VISDGNFPQWLQESCFPFSVTKTGLFKATFVKTTVVGVFVGVLVTVGGTGVCVDVYVGVLVADGVTVGVGGTGV
jgi:hypothetical protein